MSVRHALFVAAALVACCAPSLAQPSVRWNPFTTNREPERFVSEPNALYVSASRGQPDGRRGDITRPFGYVQDAINAAQVGDTVAVLDGVFYETVVLRPNVGLFIAGNAAIVRDAETVLAITNSGAYTVGGNGMIQGIIFIGADNVTARVSCGLWTNANHGNSFSCSGANNQIEIEAPIIRLNHTNNFASGSGFNLTIRSADAWAGPRPFANNATIRWFVPGSLAVSDMSALVGRLEVNGGWLFATNAPAALARLVCNGVWVTNTDWINPQRVMGTFHVVR